MHLGPAACSGPQQRTGEDAGVYDDLQRESSAARGEGDMVRPPGRAPLDLVITADDATSAIYSAILVEEESRTLSQPEFAVLVANRGRYPAAASGC